MRIYDCYKLISSEARDVRTRIQDFLTANRPDATQFDHHMALQLDKLLDDVDTGKIQPHVARGDVIRACASLMQSQCECAADCCDETLYILYTSRT